MNLITDENYKEYAKKGDIAKLVTTLSEKLNISYEEARAKLPVLVKCLTKKQLDIIVLYYYQGMNILDIAILLQEGRQYSRYLDRIHKAIDRMVRYANSHAI